MAEKKYKEAMDILDRYWHRVVSGVADEILQNRQTFKSPYLGAAEEIVMRGHLLRDIRVLRDELACAARAGDKKPVPTCEVIECNSRDVEERLNAWLANHATCTIIGTVPVMGEAGTPDAPASGPGIAVIYFKSQDELD